MATKELKKKRGNPNWIKKKNQNGQTAPIENNYTMNEKEEETETVISETPPQQEDNGNKTLPKDIFSDEMPKTEILPLEEEVVKTSYADIPVVDEQLEVKSETTEQPSSENTPSSTSQTITSSKQPKSEEEIKTQAEQTVNLLLKAYEKLHGVGRWVGKMDESKLANLHISGKINLEQEFPLGAKKITAGQFFAEYNKSIDENIVVVDEFKDAIRPPLTRVAIKHKWLITDEIYLALLISEDLSTKISILIGLKKSANLVLNSCMELMKKQKTKDNEGKHEAEIQSSDSQTSSENPSTESPVKEGQEWREPD